MNSFGIPFLSIFMSQVAPFLYIVTMQSRDTPTNVRASCMLSNRLSISHLSPKLQLNSADDVCRNKSGQHAAEYN